MGICSDKVFLLFAVKKCIEGRYSIDVFRFAVSVVREKRVVNIVMFEGIEHL